MCTRWGTHGRWEMQAPVLEEAFDFAQQGEEVRCKVREVEVGATYGFSVRVGNAHCWSEWSPSSEPLLVALNPPVPGHGDLLEVCGTADGDVVRLEWRPFRASHGLTRLEYKIMVLEWPCEGSQKISSVISRLRRAADLAGASTGPRPSSRAVFRECGYTMGCTNSLARPQSERITWSTRTLRPGMYCKFYVCARFAALPSGCMAPLPGLPVTDSLQQECITWPTDHCDTIWEDSSAWESALGLAGIWSPVQCPIEREQRSCRQPVGMSDSAARISADGQPCSEPASPC